MLPTKGANAPIRSIESAFPNDHSSRPTARSAEMGFWKMPKLWRAPMPIDRIMAPQITGTQKLRISCACLAPPRSMVLMDRLWTFRRGKPSGLSRGESDISNGSRPILKEEIEACKQAGVEFYELPIAFDALTPIEPPFAAPPMVARAGKATKLALRPP